MNLAAHSVGAIENCELDTVKAGQSFLCREPEITVFCLNDVGGRVLGKSVLSCPSIVNVLLDGFLLTEGSNREQD